MNTEKEYVLEMKDITKHYGENTVLNGVSLSVKKGEIHALLGENGAGKSTLMNLLSKSEVFAENKLFATLDTAQAVLRERSF